MYRIPKFKIFIIFGPVISLYAHGLRFFYTLCIQNDEPLFKRMMLASNAQKVFTAVYMQCLSESEITANIYNYKCASGCLFREKLNKIATATFNIKAKNFVREENDKIHEAKSKKRLSNPKSSAAARKIKKLSG